MPGLAPILLCQLASALSQRLLLNRVPPSSVDARLLLSTLPLDAHTKGRALVALDGGSLLVTKPLLTPAQCLAVRKWATPRIDTRALDSVDGLPEQQVTLPLETLCALVGEETFGRVRGWADAHGGGARSARKARTFSAFVRKYAPSSKRSLLPFHLDTNELTVNVALTSDADVRGGRLLVLHSGCVREVARAAGDATLHDSNVCHAVSDVMEGVRYSLLLFIHAAQHQIHRARPEMPRRARADGGVSRGAGPAAASRPTAPTGRRRSAAPAAGPQHRH